MSVGLHVAFDLEGQNSMTEETSTTDLALRFCFNCIQHIGLLISCLCTHSYMLTYLYLALTIVFQGKAVKCLEVASFCLMPVIILRLYMQFSTNNKLCNKISVLRFIEYRDCYIHMKFTEPPSVTAWGLSFPVTFREAGLLGGH